MEKLTPKEEEIMERFWNNGPLFVRELRELYPEPKPHFNTLSTQVRTLEEKGLLSHEAFGPTYRYQAIVKRQEVGARSLKQAVSQFFGNSCKQAVCALVKEEHLTDKEIKELIDIIQQKQ